MDTHIPAHSATAAMLASTSSDASTSKKTKPGQPAIQSLESTEPVLMEVTSHTSNPQPSVTSRAATLAVPPVSDNLPERIAQNRLTDADWKLLEALQEERLRLFPATPGVHNNKKITQSEYCQLESEISQLKSKIRQLKSKIRQGLFRTDRLDDQRHLPGGIDRVKSTLFEMQQRLPKLHLTLKSWYQTLECVCDFNEYLSKPIIPLSGEQVSYLKKIIDCGGNVSKTLAIRVLDTDSLVRYIQNTKTLDLTLILRHPAKLSLNFLAKLSPTPPLRVDPVTSSNMDEYCSQNPAEAMVLAKFMLNVLKHSRFGSDTDFYSNIESLMICCDEMVKSCPNDFEHFINTTDAQDQRCIMALAACLGMASLYQAFEDKGLKPDFIQGFESGQIISHYCKTNIKFIKRGSRTDQLELLNKAEKAAFNQATRPIDAWLEDACKTQSHISHLVSLVDWRLLPVLAAKTEDVNRIMTLAAKNEDVNRIMTRCSGYFNRELPPRVLTSTQCHLYLHRPTETWDADTQSRSHFLKIVMPLAKGLNLQTESGFMTFMDRLLHWSPPLPAEWDEITLWSESRLFYGEEDVESERRPVPDFIKRMRPEFLGSIDSTAAKEPPLPFDIRPYALNNKKNFNGMYHAQSLENYLKPGFWYKYQLIAGLLQHAEPKLISCLMEHWLRSPKKPAARDWLFEQKLHPLNMIFNEHINTNVLVNAALTLLPLARVRPLFPLQGQEGGMPVSEKSPEIMTKRADRVFGRTYMWLDSASGQKHYLKVQSDNETDEQFRLNCARQEYLYRNGQAIGLLSTCGEPVKIHTVLLNNRGVLALHFTMPEGTSYETYITDEGISDEQARDGLIKTAHDAGLLWAEGITPPDMLSAFHHTETHRSYQFLGDIATCISPGNLEFWQKSCQYPNSGTAGLRDHMDAKPATEIPSDYFIKVESHTPENIRITLAPDNPQDINRVRLHELARTAWGLALLCGKRYCQALKEQRPYDWEHHLVEPLATLFAKAFGLQVDQCIEYMQQDKLMEQTLREMRHWLNQEEAPFLQNALDRKICRDTYPDLPEGMETILLSPPKQKLVADLLKAGSGTPHLGVFLNSHNPLQAFNKLVVKMLTIGSQNLFRVSYDQNQKS